MSLLKVKHFIHIKNISFLNFFLSFFLLSFITIDTYLFIDLLNFNLYITDFIFLIFLLLIIYEYKKLFFLFLFDIKKIFFLEKILITIFFIFLIKYFLNINNFKNLYDLITFIYAIIVYSTFKFILLIDNNYKKIIINLLFYVFLISIAFVCFALMCIYLNINFENLSLWETAGYYPYHKNDITHINGLLDNYNMLSYIMLSGFIFSIFKCCINRPYFFFSSLLLFSIILFFFIKAKIVFLVFLVSIVFFIFFHYKNKSFSKYYLFFSLILIIIFYSLVTNFIILEKNFTNHTEVIQNLKYYTKVPLFSLGNYDIYGSLFYKLKVVAFEQAKSFNFFVFQSLDYNSFLEFFSKTKGSDFKIISNFDPHSLYFSFLGQYGLLGFSIIMIFFSYPFYLILTQKNLSIDAIAALTIIIILYIEALNTDIINFRFLWIVLAFLHVETYPKNLIIPKK